MNIDEFMEEDEWEDYNTVESIKAKYPDSWSLVKIINFTENTLLDVKDWCRDNCTGSYEQVGWGSDCSYTVGVIFEGLTDAVTFRLIWGSK
jgi:hypothetical protein